jgi:hypothetical protein
VSSVAGRDTIPGVSGEQVPRPGGGDQQSGVPGYCSYLRVYQPLTAFEGAQRRRVEALLAGGAGVDREEHLRRERELARREVVNPRRQLTHREGDDDLLVVLQEEGQVQVCVPGRRVRAWEALERFLEGQPPLLAQTYVPEELADAAEGWLEAARMEQTDAPGARLAWPSLRQATWQVPVGWLLLAEPHERSLQLRRPGRHLYYRVTMADARRRAARSLAVVRRTISDAANVAALEDVARWLEEFHPRSTVEIDYGDLVELLDDEALESDSSAADLADALAGLREGDGARALEGYQRVVARWRFLEMRESAN